MTGNRWDDVRSDRYRHLQPVGEVRPFPTVDLAELARKGIPAPELLCDELLMRGALHSVSGPPDCGKSTLTYWWTLHLRAAGERVIILDEESGREQVTEKLLALGATQEHLDPAGLVYVEFPGRTWDAADVAGLHTMVADVQPAMVLFDSAAAFLTLADLNEDKAGEVTRFYKGVMLDLARVHNPAVVVVDHVIKNGSGGRYARGSGAKLANVDVAIMLDLVRPFSRHQSGLLALNVTKDRRGYLHRGGFDVRVLVESGAMALKVERVARSEDTILEALRPADRKVLEVLKAASGPLTNAEIGDGIVDRFGHGLKRPTISRSLNDLEDRDLAKHTTDEFGRKRWSA